MSVCCRAFLYPGNEKMEKGQMDIKVGMAAELSVTVTEEKTAKRMGSGRSMVLATPALVALMEAAAQEILDTHMSNDWESVGTGVELKHDVMTPVGAEVTVRAEISGIDGKTVEFDLSAWDEQGAIGRGRHRRMVAKTKTLERMLRKRQA